MQVSWFRLSETSTAVVLVLVHNISNPSLSLVPSMSQGHDQEAKTKGASKAFRKGHHRRSPRACDECRLRKVKCDGSRPCQHCTFTQNGKPCRLLSLASFSRGRNHHTDTRKSARTSPERNPGRRLQRGFAYWKHGCVVFAEHWRTSKPKIRPLHHLRSTKS